MGWLVERLLRWKLEGRCLRRGLDVNLGADEVQVN